MANIYIDIESTNNASQKTQIHNSKSPDYSIPNAITKLNNTAWNKTLNHALQIISPRQ